LIWILTAPTEVKEQVEKDCAGKRHPNAQVEENTRRGFGPLEENKSRTSVGEVVVDHE